MRCCRVLLVLGCHYALGAAQPAADATETPEAAVRRLELDLEAIKQKAKEHAEAIREGAPDKLAGAQDAAGKAWGFTTTVSASAASQAEKALGKSMDRTMDMIFSFLKLSDEMVKTILSLVFNVFFCLMMVLGTMYLSADVMLIIGVTTLFVGPLLVKLLLSFLASLGMCATLRETKGYTPKCQKRQQRATCLLPSPSSELIVTRRFPLLRS